MNSKLEGYFKYNEKHVVVYNLDDSNIERVINSDNLKKQDINEIRTIDENSERFEWTFIPPAWHFEIDSVGNVILIDKTESKNKFFKKGDWKHIILIVSIFFQSL